ncbi:MAG: hypothetical protein A2381_08040 [Bdellovibrionales bacterium RIFOXYB1_FULL_37_110]|nr:MAG: hypothetical protein A2181_04805 [Bdellovibrionales bacterium RIFOXYA1_FULL_38_20]OFZ52554.1 MAG: hypothetical protein A2417_00760 [Bdellovibrionales bacterium RIFOXYC1_FULL_37_79]OFZ59756.1 MAG: hypothetical protein A2381_08040 [Bdellovibrionales bacterium RIFOXYB1_FULL_37_110]OFZ65337.1 MAG: hypothetical protein A2577_04290 [Bdellovibrionales bacterium RIFOXYD1_FULL_36_51]
MKYIAIISIIFSGYGFWQWLNRPEADLAPVDLKCTEIAVKNVKVEKINMQMSAPLKKVATSSAQTRSPEIENRDSKMNEVMEEVAYTPPSDDKLLFELSNSGVDLDDISSAMEVLETSEGGSSDEYFDELISLLPAKTREILENLIESKMIDGSQLKDFFGKYINHGMNPPKRGPNRYSGDESSYEEDSYMRDVEY